MSEHYTNKISKYNNLYCKKCYNTYKIFNSKCLYIERDELNNLSSKGRCNRFSKRNTIYCQKHHQMMLETRCMALIDCGCRCSNNRFTNMNYCLKCYFKLFNTNKIPVVLSKPKLKPLTEEDKKENKIKLLQEIDNHKKSKEEDQNFINSNYFQLLPKECLIKILIFLPLYDLKKLLEINYLHFHETVYLYYIKNKYDKFIYLNIRFDKSVSYFNELKIINKRLIKYLEGVENSIFINENYINFNDIKNKILNE